MTLIFRRAGQCSPPPQSRPHRPSAPVGRKLISVLRETVCPLEAIQPGISDKAGTATGELIESGIETLAGNMRKRPYLTVSAALVATLLLQVMSCTGVPDEPAVPRAGDDANLRTPVVVQPTLSEPTQGYQAMAPTSSPMPAATSSAPRPTAAAPMPTRAATAPTPTPVAPTMAPTPSKPLAGTEPEPALGFYDMVSVDASSLSWLLEGPLCGVRKDGVAVCLGLKYNPLQGAEPYIPTARFASVTVGEIFACGVKNDGAVGCWPTRGLSFLGPDLPVPEGRFDSVSVGGYHACGIRPDASVECWFAWGGTEWDDNDNAGQATPPEGGFRSVSAGSHHTCGIRIEGTIACWGLDESEGGSTSARHPWEAVKPRRRRASSGRSAPATTIPAGFAATAPWIAGGTPGGPCPRERSSRWMPAPSTPADCGPRVRSPVGA